MCEKLPWRCRGSSEQSTFMKAVLASANPHKIEEFQNVLKGKLEIISPENKLEVEETGESFFENALLKARAYSEKFKGPALSDDSGLVVEALPGKLGVYSARFGGDGLSDKQRSELLLKKMEGVENRESYFVCVLCLYFNEEHYFFFEGRLKGQIRHDPVGDQGFGYDPVFTCDEIGESESAASQPAWKEKNSHRAKAVEGLLRFLETETLSTLEKSNKTV